MAETVRLRHPKARRQLTVAADSAGMYERQGWVRIQSRTAKKAAKKVAARKATPSASSTPAAGA